jgi:hypothetical protein
MVPRPERHRARGLAAMTLLLQSGCRRFESCRAHFILSFFSNVLGRKSFIFFWETHIKKRDIVSTMQKRSVNRSPFFDEQITEEQIRKGKELQKYVEKLKKEIEEARRGEW